MFRLDAREVILGEGTGVTLETFLFDPAAGEASLGNLFIVAEAETRDGLGTELIEMVVQAIQREYYRDAKRGAVLSFESALHQANLILHDAFEQGMRDWMTYWHVSVGVIAESDFHLSVAGAGAVMLVRGNSVSLISEDLAQFPIQNPLRTFSQVASGSVQARDTIFFGTSRFPYLYRRDDLKRFSLAHEAELVATRLQQLYADLGAHDPLAGIVVSLWPEKIVSERVSSVVDLHDRPKRGKRVATNSLHPRKPLAISNSALRAFFSFVKKQTITLFQIGAPVMARASGAAVRQTKRISRSAVGRIRGEKPTFTNDENEAIPASRKRFNVKRIAQTFLFRVARGWQGLPITSKIFAGLSAVLLVAFVSSLFFLQTKRTTDADIERASELLHSARTKQEAASAALIYGNRDQARQLLGEAREAVRQVEAMELYQDEAQNLEHSITAEFDSLQKVVRVSLGAGETIGDFGAVIPDGLLSRIFFVNDNLFAFDSTTNAIARMELTGDVELVHENTEGIGFFVSGVSHEADKVIVLLTDSPGLALFDTTNNTVEAQTTTFSAADPEIRGMSPFGSRLYIYDRTANDIFSYSKTLRGYDQGGRWIKGDTFPRESIIDIAVDGSIYTLHEDGTLRELFKGEERELEVEKVDPKISKMSRIMTTEDVTYIYIFDEQEQRVVQYTKKGALVQQFLFDESLPVRDVTIALDEESMYLLSGTQVQQVQLARE